MKLFPGVSSTGVDCELIYMLNKNYSKNINLEIKNAIHKSSNLIAKKIGTLMSYSGKNNKLIMNKLISIFISILISFFFIKVLNTGTKIQFHFQIIIILIINIFSILI